MSQDRDTLDPRPRSPARSRLLLAAAAIVTVMALVAVLPADLLGRSSVAVAVTPPLQGFELTEGQRAGPSLRALQERVAGLPSAEEAGSDEHVVRTESWSLSSRVDDGDVVRSAVVPELRELRWRDDGSGSLRSITGEPQFPDEEYRRAWQDNGRPADTGAVLSDEVFGPGEYQPMYPKELSMRPTILLDQLSTAHPIAQIGTAELFVAIADLYREQLPVPMVRAALFELLQQRADVRSLGMVTDRAGRTGIAYFVDSDYTGLPTRYIQIYDPDDGRLFATEDVLTADAGKLNVPIPSVISYETFLEST